MTDRPMTRDELLDCTKNTDYEVEGQLLTGTRTHSDNPEDLEASSVQMLPRTALTLWTRGTKWMIGVRVQLLLTSLRFFGEYGTFRLLRRMNLCSTDCFFAHLYRFRKQRLRFDYCCCCGCSATAVGFRTLFRLAQVTSTVCVFACCSM